MTRDEQAIRDVQAAWFEATADGDLPRLLSLMSDDAIFLVAGRPPFGREQFAAMFQAGLASFQITGERDLEEVMVDGNTAYTRTRLDLSLVPNDGGTNRRLAGYAMSVFRRDPVKGWLLARDANLLTPRDDSPAAMPSEKEAG